MTEQLDMLQGDALVQAQHTDHAAARRFMASLGLMLGPAYKTWQTENSWEAVTIPEPYLIPTPGIELDGSRDQNLWRSYAWYAMGKDRNFSELWQSGLAILDHAAGNATVDPRYLIYGSDASLHKANVTILRSMPLVYKDAYPQDRRIALGEIAVTNIGVGDETGYHHLNAALAKSLQAIAMLKPKFDAFYQAQTEESESVMRALVADPSDVLYNRAYYNPIYHTALEGMMSVGQSVNALLQPGIQNDEGWSVDELTASILRKQLPAVLARVMLVGDIGAQQMAGIAEAGLAEVYQGSVRLVPEAVRLMVARQDRERAANQKITGDELVQLQEPAFRAVNRHEGCPANKAVRIMSQMLLDALQSTIY